MKLRGVHLTLLTFTKTFQNNFFHVQMDNTVALIYLVKMGGTRKKQILQTKFGLFWYRKLSQLEQNIWGGLSTWNKIMHCAIFRTRANSYFAWKLFRKFTRSEVRLTWTYLRPGYFTKCQHALRYTVIPLSLINKVLKNVRQKMDTISTTGSTRQHTPFSSK